jgi:hypothetical protein
MALVAPRVSTFDVDYPAAIAMVRKSLRTEIRLKHSIAADLELATMMPKVDKILRDLGLHAAMPTLDDVKTRLRGEPLTGWKGRQPGD